MKNTRCALALLLALALAAPAGALDAVSLLSGGNVNETGNAASDAAKPAPAAAQPESAGITPYSPASNAEECARRAEIIGRQLEDWNKLPVPAAAARFGVSKSTVHKDVTRRLRTISTPSSRMRTTSRMR